MLKIAHLSEIPARQVRSPQGKYQLKRQSVSEALGGIKDVGEWGGGHPFDVEFFTIPPNAANFPLHAHAAQWEMYLILSGSGEVRGADGSKPIAAGDHVMFAPGEPHQIRNTGETDLTYYVVTNQPRADIVTYPDTPGKFAMKPGGKCFTKDEMDYYAPGE
ncbi:MAG: cupin domain-containing protein [Chthoniobacteraceae bacterium]